MPTSPDADFVVGRNTDVNSTICRILACKTSRMTVQDMWLSNAVWHVLQCRTCRFIKISLRFCSFRWLPSPLRPWFPVCLPDLFCHAFRNMSHTKYVVLSFRFIPLHACPHPSGRANLPTSFPRVLIFNS